MPNSDWRDEIWTFDQINQFAAVRGELSSAMAFLHSIQAVPYEVAKMPAPDYIITNLDPKGIRAGYLAALASEWDKDGPSSPKDFVDSLRPELMGSPQRDAVREQLEMAGKENT